MKHTAGPWEWELVDEQGAVPVHTLRGPIVLCRWWDTPASKHLAQLPYDARLIAAAPEMYEALRYAEKYTKGEEVSPAYLTVLQQLVQRALSKVEGE